MEGKDYELFLRVVKPDLHISHVRKEHMDAVEAQWNIFSEALIMRKVAHKAWSLKLPLV